MDDFEDMISQNWTQGELDKAELREMMAGYGSVDPDCACRLCKPKTSAVDGLIGAADGPLFNNPIGDLIRQAWMTGVTWIAARWRRHREKAVARQMARYMRASESWNIARGVWR